MSFPNQLDHGGRERCTSTTACGVDLEPDPCCVSPCDPPWCSDEVGVVCCETRCLCVPIQRDCERPETTILAGKGTIELRVMYEHRLCLAGKQHGPLLFTQTLLPGEKVTLVHHERYRRVTGEADRFSVQATFLQFLSAVHQARAAGGLAVLSERLASARGSAAAAVGGGLAGLLGGGSTEVRVTDPHQLRVGAIAEAFHRSATQAAQLTGAERSIVITSHDDRDTVSGTARTLHNTNDCRAVTYFIRQVMELLALTTRVCEISFRVLAPGLPPHWHSIEDMGGIPGSIREEIEPVVRHLPECGETVGHPRLVALPSDGAVYDPELARCCSCEPERAAALAIQLEQQKAEALQACLEVQALEVELERRRLLLQKGDLAPSGG